MNELIRFSIDHIAVIQVYGKDAIKFLQGQCTQDLSTLKAGQFSLGAFCSAKGRAITNVWLTLSHEDSTSVWMLCHRSSADLLITHLSKYIAFFRGTTIQEKTAQWTTFGLSDLMGQPISLPDAQPDGAVQSAKLPDGRMIIWFASDVDHDQEILKIIHALPNRSISIWHKQDIESKTLWLDAQQSELWIPQNVSLDLLDGISFNKGCYTGQEVIARLHFKGQSKKRLYAIKWPESNDGTSLKIIQEKRPVGDIVQSVTSNGTTYALAILTNESVKNKLYLDDKRQIEIQLLN